MLRFSDVLPSSISGTGKALGPKYAGAIIDGMLRSGDVTMVCACIANESNARHKLRKRFLIIVT